MGVFQLKVLKKIDQKNKIARPGQEAADILGNLSSRK